MAALKLVANPTFKASVPIPVAGGDAVNVEMTFKHRTKKTLGEWISSRSGNNDSDSFMDMAIGWELEEPFTKENVDLLLEIYGGAGIATFRKYIEELTSGKTKNL